MIDFRPVKSQDKELYNKYLPFTAHRGCEYTFANLLMWGEQKTAEIDGVLLRLSFYDNHYSYAFPIGSGNIKKAIEEIISDAEERGIPCSFFGVYKEDAEILEEFFPERFAFIKARDSFDYVYDITALATLKGRKYHSKRNHLHRFAESFPDYCVEPLDKHNLHKVSELAENWYEQKLLDNPDGDFEMEKTALSVALSNYETLQFEGLLLKNGDDILAFTLGSRMNSDTFDVHFEKAVTPAAYVAINNEFAKYINNKYPEIKYLDREEDMGLEGLRKAKISYRPHKLTEKFRAVLINENLTPRCAVEKDKENLYALWQEAFGDSRDFLDTFRNTAYAHNRCRLIADDKGALAALYIFDCIYKGEKIAYIYAVATAKSHRGQGLCTLLMADTHRYLVKNGYRGAILVPADETLFSFYENMGYEVCTYASEFSADAQGETLTLEEISSSEYAKLRKDYLDESAVLQEGENLRFLETYARFYKGYNFIFTAHKDEDTLRVIEILGHTDKFSEIVKTLDCNKGTFRTKGKEKPFAMCYPLCDSIKDYPSYLGFAFD